MELIFSDLEAIDKKIERSKKLLKADKKYQFEIDTLEKVKYENGIVMISFNEEYEKISEDEKNLIYESVYKTLIKLTEVSDVKIISTVNENDENGILENRNVTCNVI